MTLPPIRRSISVPWGVDAAFRRFTADFGKWWPSRTHSIGGELVTAIVFEPRVGGRIFEQHADGRRFQWGEICDWEPPRRLRFTWHPGRDASTAQDVEVEFTAADGGTQVELTASGWERWGENARRAHRGYNIGWAYVLDIWAQRRTPRTVILDAIAAVMGLVRRLRGGVQAEIAQAGGEMPRV